jgi:hypothetical protein
LTIDTKVPTIVISSDVDKLKAGESTTITFTLSEVVTTISVASKSVDTSLRVKVMVALSSALSLLTLLLMAMVSGFASSVVTPF